MKTIQQALFRYLGVILIVAVTFMQSVPASAISSLFDSTLALDGVDDYASAPDASSLDLGTADGEDFTIETFFYVPDLTNTASDTLFWKQGAYGLSILYSDSIQDRLIFRLYTGVLTTDYVYIYYDVNLSVGWHHIVAVFDNEYTLTSDLAALYLDGNQVATGTGVDWTPGIWNSSSALSIGAYSGINPTVGWLDETRFSDIVRYTGATYTVPSSAFTNDINTRALWHFDDAWGATSFTDSSTKGNTLTGFNGAHIGNPTNTPPSVPGAFGKTSPTNGAINQTTSPTLSWDVSSSVTSYEYCYDTTNDNSCSLWTGNGTFTNKILSGLTPSTTYYWQVRANNAGGTTYANTNTWWSFTTLSGTSTFTDVSITYWANSYIERLYNAGITGGCSVTPLNYCPDATVTRAQMAVFLLKGMHGSSFTPPDAGASTGFTDVATNYWAAAWIKQLASEGITGGCGTGVYCPDATVTRAQMAVFLLRSVHGSSYSPPIATGVFTDVPVGYWADKWIEQLATEGVTSGCGAGIYCPDNSVTRAQMAVFLVKAFNLP